MWISPIFPSQDSGDQIVIEDTEGRVVSCWKNRENGKVVSKCHIFPPSPPHFPSFFFHVGIFSYIFHTVFVILPPFSPFCPILPFSTIVPRECHRRLHLVPLLQQWCPTVGNCHQSLALWTWVPVHINTRVLLLTTVFLRHQHLQLHERHLHPTRSQAWCETDPPNVHGPLLEAHYPS